MIGPWSALAWIHALSLGRISGLYRHAVKGLSADSLESVVVAAPGTLPDDRRFALLLPDRADFDPSDPSWLHKENFLCAFSAPELMAEYRASYSIVRETREGDPLPPHGLPCDRVVIGAAGGSPAATKRLLTLHERATETAVLGPLDLAEEDDRAKLADFFGNKSGKPLVCVAAEPVPGGTGNKKQDDDHGFQFGNTSTGWKRNKDTRTVHIVHESTVEALRKATGYGVLNPTRFRPNIVLQGDDQEPFCEWDWIGKTLACGDGVRLRVVSKTVRCEGVSLDPSLDPASDEFYFDVPGKLQEHFPEHGPYLGVYAVIEEGGRIGLDDEAILLSE